MAKCTEILPDGILQMIADSIAPRRTLPRMPLYLATIPEKENQMFVFQDADGNLYEMLYHNMQYCKSLIVYRKDLQGLMLTLSRIDSREPFEITVDKDMTLEQTYYVMAAAHIVARRIFGKGYRVKWNYRTRRLFTGMYKYFC